MARRIRTAALIAATLLISACLSPGCGGGVDLAYDGKAGSPVIIYRSYKAIAPVYNPDVPVTVIYGDGTVIKKEDAYSYTTGKTAGDGVDGVLRSLSEKGFFDMEEEYVGEPLTGGTTEVITVNLKVGITGVSVQSGSGPTNWSDIVAVVKDVKTAGTRRYTPEGIVLYGSRAAAPPGGIDVVDWPGDAADLQKAASAHSRGYLLGGDEAALAWRAVKKSIEAKVDIVWRAGDGFYRYVYAKPLLPGIPQD